MPCTQREDLPPARPPVDPPESAADDDVLAAYRLEILGVCLQAPGGSWAVRRRSPAARP